MSEKLSIGNKNHGSCVNNELGTASSMRPSAAWDIWDKVWQAKRKCLRIEVGSRTLFVWSCCMKQSLWCYVSAEIYIVMQGDVTRKLVSSREAQFPGRIFYFNYTMTIIG